jgi:hypothetical protein
VLPELKIDIPELEPDPVLLAQLSQLSAVSVPPRREGPVRILVAAVTVVVLAFFSWLTGAVPGVASPFDGIRHHHSAPSQAPASPSAPALDGSDAAPPLPGALPPGQVRTHQDSGNHAGLTKPGHEDSGNHTGLINGQENNGSHTGQTKVHQNHGHHTGQVKPHQNHGHHTGQTKPHQNHGHHTGQGQADPKPGGNGHTGEGNGHRT